MPKDLQENFIFLLVPCYKPKCVRPVCSKGCPEKEETWFDSSHPVDVVSLAISDRKNLLEHTAKNASKIVQAIICHLNYNASGQSPLPNF